MIETESEESNLIILAHEQDPMQTCLIMNRVLPTYNSTVFKCIGISINEPVKERVINSTLIVVQGEWIFP